MGAGNQYWLQFFIFFVFEEKNRGKIFYGFDFWHLGVAWGEDSQKFQNYAKIRQYYPTMQYYVILCETHNLPPPCIGASLETHGRDQLGRRFGNRPRKGINLSWARSEHLLIDLLAPANPEPTKDASERGESVGIRSPIQPLEKLEVRPGERRRVSITSHGCAVKKTHLLPSD